ncbi:MAG: glutamate--tRNA ligase [Firmicutes bacterium]|nr:glutamate--tRNA ligase [Bacillota bacterium]
MMRTRTRFAPSPTGFMHIGNLRTAIFEYLVAKHDDGDFILRVEDTDQNRKVEGAIDFIYNTLNLCKMEISEGPNNEGEYGPYIQSERVHLYKQYAEELVKMGKAYYCFCSEDVLGEMRAEADRRKKPFMYDGRCSRLSQEQIEAKINNGEKYVIRQKMPKEGTSVVHDLVYGDIKVDNNVLEDQILLKSDGYPTYNFANVIDDHLMKITHVIRGNEYLSQTPKYNLLYEAFGWEAPTYIHVPMVLGEDGNKLSKRNGDASFMDLYNEGYLPEAVVNYLVLLGWSPETNQEIYTMDELIKAFDAKRISKSPSSYDIKKLRWFNAKYIKNLSDEDYLKFVKPFLTYDVSDKSEEWVNKLLLIYKDHLSYGNEINELVGIFFNDEINISRENQEFLNSDENIPLVISAYKNELSNITEWNVENIAEVINKVKEKTGIKGKLLYMPMRIKISGVEHGPELPDEIYLIGKDKVIDRLK